MFFVFFNNHHCQLSLHLRGLYQTVPQYWQQIPSHYSTLCHSSFVLFRFTISFEQFLNMCNDVIALLSWYSCRNLKPLQQQNQHFHELFCPCGNKKTAAVLVFEKATADLVYRHWVVR